MAFDPFGGALEKGRLLRRYKRFLADVEMDGEVETVHCPNPGSMAGLAEPGHEVLVLRHDDPRRKLPYSLEFVRPPSMAWVGVNTQRPNQVVAWALSQGLLPWRAREVRREVPLGASRIDFLVDGHFVEVKNTTLAVEPGGALAQGRGPHCAAFPDSVTARGARHVKELASCQAAVVFLVNRGDCNRFTVADWIDPTFAKALAAAEAEGLQVVPLGCRVGERGFEVTGVLPRA